MFETLITFIASSKPLLLFTIIGIGYLIGRIEFFGISLGVAAVLFTGLFFGAMAPGRLELPPEIYQVGLILFVYMMGLQSGPGFFASFKTRGLEMNAIAIISVIVALLASVLCKWFFGLSKEMTAGLFSGSLTNTPALASALESIRRSGGDISAPIIGYSISYPFAVLGSILALHFMSKIWKVNFSNEMEKIQKEEFPEANRLETKNFRVVNTRLLKNKITAAELSQQTGVVFSRFKRNSVMEPVISDTVFRKGDIVVAVGSSSILEKTGIILGPESNEHLEYYRGRLDFRRIIVSNPSVIGKTVGSLPIQHFGAVITRIRRGDIEFVPLSSTILEMGDRVRVVAYTEHMNDVTNYFGDSMKKVSEMEILSPAFGMVIGVLIGMIPVPLPNGTVLSLGFAGGPLVVALILGRLGKTGSIHWNIPQPVNLSLRQFGLILFLAGVGLRAGNGFLSELHNTGWKIFLSGVIVTLAAVLPALFMGRFRKIFFVRISGMISGMLTQPAVLAAANKLVLSDKPSLAYTTVYPAVMILKIILIQILLSL